MLYFMIALAVLLILYFYIKNNPKILKPTKEKIVVITGCDSGVGYAVANEAFKNGFTTVAGCLSLDSEGGQALRNLKDERIIVVKCDITQMQDVQNLHLKVSKLLENLDYCK